MTMSKRVALLGARGLSSSFGLIGRRPLPYRSFSDLTKDTKHYQEHNYTLLQYETERLRRDMRLELRSEIDKSTNNTNKLAKEFEATKYDFVQCSIGALLGGLSFVSYEFWIGF